MLGLTLVMTANKAMVDWSEISPRRPRSDCWTLPPEMSQLFYQRFEEGWFYQISFPIIFFCFLLWDKIIPENVTPGLKIWHRRHIVVTLHCTVKTQTENKHICFHFRREVVSKQAVMLCLQQTWLLVGRDRWKKNLHLKLRSNFDCALYKATVWSFLSC